MSSGLEGSQWAKNNFVVTDDVVKSLGPIIQFFSEYLSSYIHVLNKFISHLRRVGTLRFERTTLIKFVKKLRFFNDTLFEFNLQSIYQFNEGSNSLYNAIKQFAMYFDKVLEVMDVLNFYLTQSLQKEIISKTLNTSLTLTDESILAIDDAYNHFVKYTQWMIESLGNHNNLLDLEVIRFTIKCAEEDGTDLETTDNIFLQEVIEVDNVEEYCTLTLQWSEVLNTKVNALKESFNELSNKWHEKFGKKGAVV